jgi:virginiamycin A acetyltransferase
MIKAFAKSILGVYYKMKWNNSNVRFLNNSKIDRITFFEGYNSIGESTIMSNCYIGCGTYISKHNHFTGIKFGRYCSIGSFIINTAGIHPTTKFASTHPAFFSKGKAAGFTFSEEQKFQELKYVEENYLVVVGNDVWIGDNVTIMSGVKIGDGAIIGSNCLVVKDILPFSINVGVPSKVIKYRFSDEIIGELLFLKWWNKGFKWIKENSIYFSDVEVLIKKIKEEK